MPTCCAIRKSTKCCGGCGRAEPRASCCGETPDYVRRFVASTHLYDGEGFEVTEPLATKMASRPHNEKPFDLLAPSYQYYDHEFERYWHFFQLFGRLGYNPDASAEIWEREFEQRFGPKAAPIVQQALHRASQILPRIIASSLPPDKFPTTRGWPEKQRWGDIWQYAKANPVIPSSFSASGSSRSASRRRRVGEDTSV